ERHAPASFTASAVPRLAGWPGGRRALRAGLLPAARAVFSFVSHGVYVLAGGGARLPRPPYAASSGRWSVGHGDSTGAGVSGAPAPPHARAVCAVVVWYIRALSLDSSRWSHRPRNRAVSAPVSTCAVFSRACWPVLCGLVGAGICLEQVVPPARAGAGSAGHPLPATTPGAVERHRTCAVWTHHDVCGGGLDDVAGAALVLQHLWIPGSGRAVPGGDGVCHYSRLLAGPGRTVGLGNTAGVVARPWESVAGLCPGLGLQRLCATADHLGR